MTNPILNGNVNPDPLAYYYGMVKKGDELYVSTGRSINAHISSIYSFSISDPALPVYEGSIPVPDLGSRKISLYGNYLFTIANLCVFNLDTAFQPVLVETSGEYCNGSDVLGYGEYLYNANSYSLDVYHMDISVPVDDEVIPIPEDEVCLSIYPNPIVESRGKLNISLDEKTAQNNTISFKLYNIKGQCVYSANKLSAKGGTGLYEATLPMLSRGIYLCRVRASEREYSKKLLIKD